MPNTRFHLAFPLAALVLLQAAASASATESYRTVVIFGDTQRMIRKTTDLPAYYLRHMVKWVTDHKESENIDFVHHVGDAIQSWIVCTHPKLSNQCKQRDW